MKRPKEARYIEKETNEEEEINDEQRSLTFPNTCIAPPSCKMKKEIERKGKKKAHPLLHSACGGFSVLSRKRKGGSDVREGKQGSTEVAVRVAM